MSKKRGRRPSAFAREWAQEKPARRPRHHFVSGKIPARRGYTKRPDLIEALCHMEVLDVPLVWDSITPHTFHSAICNQPKLEGMRFRTFTDRYKGALALFIVRVE